MTIATLIFIAVIIATALVFVYGKFIAAAYGKLPPYGGVYLLSIWAVIMYFLLEGLGVL